LISSAEHKHKLKLRDLKFVHLWLSVLQSSMKWRREYGAAPSSETYVNPPQQDYMALHPILHNMIVCLEEAQNLTFGVQRQK